jgi:hypothetical protein
LTDSYGSSDLTLHFAMVRQFNVGNRVFVDVDLDGSQSAGDVNVTGVRVRLLSAGAGAVVAESVTDASGQYNFNSLIAGLLPASPYLLTIAMNQTVTLPSTGSGVLSALYEPTRTGLTARDALDSNGVLNLTLGVTQAAITTPAFGVDDTTVDFGFVRQFSFGDFVWLDTNGNGTQDAGEPGIVGVLVKLFGGADARTLVAETTTAAGGLYRFNSYVHDLDANVPYVVRIDMEQPVLARRLATRALVAGVDPARDSNGAVAGGGRVVSAAVPGLRSNETLLTIDFGFVNTLDVGDFVWLDQNGDGLQGTVDVEPGLANVTVELRAAIGGAVLATTATNGTGFYVFSATRVPTMLPLAEHVLSISLAQAALQQLHPTASLAAGGAARDSNGLVVAAASEARFNTPNFGAVDNNIDFGFRPRIYVGDRVWFDRNFDGLQTPGEPGIGGVPVFLFDVFGIQLSATLTDAAGAYYFDSSTTRVVAAARFTVSVSTEVAALATMQPTLADVGADDELDSDGRFVVSAAASQATFSTMAWGFNMTFAGDFGFVPQFSVGGRVWLDAAPADGVQQSSGESGIAGVVVRLRDPATDAQLAAATTDANGRWAFFSQQHALLPRTTYAMTIEVLQTPLVELQPTRVNVGGNDTLDSDAVLDGGKTRAAWTIVTPDWGVHDRSSGAGFVRRFRVRGRVWRDVNGDGVQDAGDRSISGVVVRLHDAVNGSRLATERADNAGAYAFESMRDTLEPLARYVVVVERAQAELDGLQQAVADVGADDGVDSDGRWRAADLAGGAALFGNVSVDAVVMAAATAPAHGASDTQCDFGFVERLALGGVVWKDVGRDGAQSPGDGGIANTTVRLLLPNGTEAARALSDEDGRYAFDSFNVAALVAQASFRLAVEWDQPSLRVTSGVWAGSTLRAALPNALGSGSLADALDSDGVAALLNGRNASVVDVRTLAWGSGNRTIDFGFEDPPLVGTEIGNFLWIDSNADGLQSAGEGPLAGALVQLLDGVTLALVATTLSTSSGQYRFSSVVDGYRQNVALMVAVPLGDASISGLVVTTARVGADATIDSDGAYNDGFERVEARLTSPFDGQSNQTIDFGFLRIELAGRVWKDIDGDGDQDAAEASLRGIVVRLETPAGELLATTATSGDGLYQFTSNEDGLRPDGEYRVVVDSAQAPLLGFNVTLANSNATGVTDATDSDAVYLGGTRAGISVRIGAAFGVRAVANDFGFAPKLEIGDYVWNDANGDGAQDASEAPLAGVLVELRDAAGAVLLATTLTSAAGAYVFDAARSGVLPETDYVVAVPIGQMALDGLNPTAAAPVGTLRDSNGVLNAARSASQASVTTGAFGTVDRSVDFGFVGAVSVGDLVWLDANGDGVYGMNELPVANVTLELRTAAGALVATTQSSAAGRYLFDSSRLALRPLTAYTIVLLDLPTGLQVTALNGGSDDTLDSDAIYVMGDVQVPVVTPAAGSAALDYDIGLAPQSSIGDRVWLDGDGDGLQTAGESGLADVVVRLIDRGSGDVIAVTSTDANGTYRFNSFANSFLANKAYELLVFPPPFHRPTQFVIGSDREVDSNGQAVGAGSATVAHAFVTGPPGTDDRSLDFGFVFDMLFTTASTTAATATPRTTTTTTAAPTTTSAAPTTAPANGTTTTGESTTGESTTDAGSGNATISVLSGSNETTLLVYAADGTTVVGRLTFPAGGLRFADGSSALIVEVARVADAAGGNGTQSATVAVRQAMLRRNTDDQDLTVPVRVCLAPSSALPSAALCLAARNSTDSPWLCEDRRLVAAEQEGAAVGLLCGDARRVALLALVPHGAPDQGTDGERGDLTTPASFLDEPLWLLLLLLVIPLVLVGVLICCCVARRRRRDADREEESWRVRASESDAAAGGGALADEQEDVGLARSREILRSRRMADDAPPAVPATLAALPRGGSSRKRVGGLSGSGKTPKLPFGGSLNLPPPPRAYGSIPAPLLSASLPRALSRSGGLDAATARRVAENEAAEQNDWLGHSASRW